MSIFRSRQFWAGVGLASLFVPLAAFLSRPYLFAVVYGLTISVSFGVIAAYLPGIVRSFGEERWTGSNYLVLGVVATWVATATLTIWRWIWRASGRPEVMEDALALVFMTYLTVMGGMLHLAAGGAIDGDIPRANWVRVGVAVAIGLGLAALVVVLAAPGAAVPP